MAEKLEGRRLTVLETATKQLQKETNEGIVLTAEQLGVLLAFYERRGLTPPTPEALAEGLGLETSAVIQALNELKEKGLASISGGRYIFTVIGSVAMHDLRRIEQDAETATPL